jgi:hypothetical protein
MKKILIINLIMFLSTLCNLFAQSARDIMINFDKVSKEASFSLIERMKLSTCRYIVQDGKMRVAEKPRVSILEVVAKDTGIDNQDTRSVSIVIEPTRDKGICMLAYSYAASSKDDDNWLYLPILSKVKRLVANSEDNDESGSFFGSEFSIEDIGTRKIDDYTYKLIEENTYSNRPVWVIELIPTAERANKTKYGKIILWLDKERSIILKQDLYNRNSILFKQLTTNNIENIDNVWVARRAEMNNLLTRRITIMELTDIAYNIEIPDEFLTQRVLIDFAFREKELIKLRIHLK